MSSMQLVPEEVTVRSFEWDRDRTAVEELERKCEGPFLITESMGDPLGRIRHSPAYEMLVRDQSKLSFTCFVLICFFGNDSNF